MKTTNQMRQSQLVKTSTTWVQKWSNMHSFSKSVVMVYSMMLLWMNVMHVTSSTQHQKATIYVSHIFSLAQPSPMLAINLVEAHPWHVLHPSSHGFSKEFHYQTSHNAQGSLGHVLERRIGRFHQCSMIFLTTTNYINHEHILQYACYTQTPQKVQALAWPWPFPFWIANWLTPQVVETVASLWWPLVSIHHTHPAHPGAVSNVETELFRKGSWWQRSSGATDAFVPQQKSHSNKKGSIAQIRHNIA